MKIIIIKAVIILLKMIIVILSYFIDKNYNYTDYNNIYWQKLLFLQITQFFAFFVFGSFQISLF
jgi:hypothetical protein